MAAGSIRLTEIVTIQRRAVTHEARRSLPRRNAEMRLHWRDDLDENMRVIRNALAWDIRGIAEQGRRRWTVLTCRTDASRRA